VYKTAFNLLVTWKSQIRSRIFKYNC